MHTLNWILRTITIQKYLHGLNLAYSMHCYKEVIYKEVISATECCNIFCVRLCLCDID